MVPLPGGGAYRGTSEGGAMAIFFPKTTVVSDVGILSSSTHIYSRSLP